tara:strand:- start:251 stop:697 length:447 start_codon:yes stop_codon:yes gene_type:complete
MSIRIALYQPDIPQNCGAMMRLCAGLGVGLDIIEPCGFILDDRKLRRVGMDYVPLSDRQRFSSWDAFLEGRAQNRHILMTTKVEQSYFDFEFQDGDILIAGSESSGVPLDIHQSLPHKVTIPMFGDARSLNVVTATAMIAGEALRQTR